MGEGGDPGLAGGQQFLHREFGRGVQIHRPRLPIGADGRGGKAVQMRLVAGADLQRCRVHLDEILLCQPAADSRLNAVAGHQQWSAIGVKPGGPPGRRGLGHGVSFRLAKRWQMR